MAGRKAAPKDGAGNSTDLTTRELQILGLAWQCFDAPPKVSIFARLGVMRTPPLTRDIIEKSLQSH